MDTPNTTTEAPVVERKEDMPIGPRILLGDIATGRYTGFPIGPDADYLHSHQYINVEGSFYDFKLHITDKGRAALESAQ